MLKQTAAPSRRFHRRIETPSTVWVVWSCGGRDKTSRVADLSLGGLFIVTDCPAAIGAEAHLEFLVPDAQVRAKAVVRHLEPGRGLGLQFTAISERECSRLIGLLNRFRGLPQISIARGDGRNG